MDVVVLVVLQVHVFNVAMSVVDLVLTGPESLGSVCMWYWACPSWIVRSVLRLLNLWRYQYHSVMSYLIAKFDKEETANEEVISTAPQVLLQMAGMMVGALDVQIAADSQLWPFMANNDTAAQAMPEQFHLIAEPLVREL